jgi:hypothetical protein
MLKALIATMIVILILVLGWHILFPLLGGVIAISALVWGLIIGSILIFCLVILLLFALGGIGVFIVGGLFAVWTLIAIVLFPVLFPILLPLLIIWIFVAVLRSNKKVQ